MARLRYTLPLALLVASAVGCGGSGGGSSDSDNDSDSETETEVIGNTPLAGIIDSADDEEQLFAFAAPAAGVYNVLLNWPNAASDLDLFITDGSDSYFTLAANGNSESVNIALAAGDLLAIAVNAFQTSGPQSFTISAAATSQPAHSPGHIESEPNDTLNTGNIIGFGEASGIVSWDRPPNPGMDPGSGTDGNDYFVYLAQESAVHTISLTWTNPQRDLDLYIGWGDMGDVDESVASGTESETLTPQLDVGEQLRIAVDAYDTDNLPVSYSLTIEAQ